MMSKTLEESAIQIAESLAKDKLRIEVGDESVCALCEKGCRDIITGVPIEDHAESCLVVMAQLWLACYAVEVHAETNNLLRRKLKWVNR